MRAIDLFAGAGGFSQGAKQAGVNVLWSANHWPLAVRTHALNHPHTDHQCQDLNQADWFGLPEYDILLASPACQGHSTASQPSRTVKHDADRATAWAVVDAAEASVPTLIVVENVPQFRNWVFYRLWVHCLELLGYHIQEYILDAADFGVPQNRKRLFVIGDQRGCKSLYRPPVDHRPIGDIIQWNKGNWKPIDIPQRSPNTIKRINRGRKRLGHSFLTQHVTNHPGRSLERPIGTITTKDQWCVVRGDEMRPLTIAEYKMAMGFDLNYQLLGTRTEKIKLLGNAVPPPVVKCVLESLR